MLKEAIDGVSEVVDIKHQKQRDCNVSYWCVLRFDIVKYNLSQPHMI